MGTPAGSRIIAIVVQVLPNVIEHRITNSG